MNKKLKVIIFAWAVMATFSYGHITKASRATDKADCADQRAHGDRFCSSHTYIPGVEAIFWPFHWSDVVWQLI